MCPCWTNENQTKLCFYALICKHSPNNFTMLVWPSFCRNYEIGKRIFITFYIGSFTKAYQHARTLSKSQKNNGHISSRAGFISSLTLSVSDLIFIRVRSIRNETFLENLRTFYAQCSFPWISRLSKQLKVILYYYLIIPESINWLR